MQTALKSNFDSSRIVYAQGAFGFVTFLYLGVKSNPLPLPLPPAVLFFLPQLPLVVFIPPSPLFVVLSMILKCT